MKLAVIQMHVAKEKEKNLQTAQGYIQSAAEKGADMVLLPEMFCCPYLAVNFPVYAEEEGGDTWQYLSAMAKKHHIYMVAGSVPEKTKENQVYNTSYVFDPEGRQIAKHRKVHLFDIEIKGGQCFRESDTLTAGQEVTVFGTEFGRFGLCICYDIRFPELSRLMVLEGAQAILVPGAFNMTTGPAHWEILFRTRAFDNQVYCIGAAPAREEKSDYVSYGNSIAVSPWGEVLHRLTEQEGMFLCELDMDYVEKVRRELPLLKHRRTDLYTITKK